MSAHCRGYARETLIYEHGENNEDKTTFHHLAPLLDFISPLVQGCFVQHFSTRFYHNQRPLRQYGYAKTLATLIVPARCVRSDSGDYEDYVAQRAFRVDLTYGTSPSGQVYV